MNASPKVDDGEWVAPAATLVREYNMRGIVTQAWIQTRESMISYDGWVGEDRTEPKSA